MPDNSKDILEIWHDVDIPGPPPAQDVEVDSVTTALLILDVQQQNCAKRPRCLAALPRVKALLERARASGVAVVYTLTKKATREDVLEEVAPRDEEPSVASGVDKFFNTELESILAGKNIQTVILAGTAAHGAVLHTGTGASIRGMKIVVPVDCMTSLETYTEQYSAWHLANAPGSKAQATITRSTMIRIN